MTRTVVFRRVCGLGAAALFVTVLPAGAAQGPPMNPDAPARAFASTFEVVLRAAVISGGQKLAKQASAVVPEAVLAVTEQPIVRGVKLDGWGFFFDVQAPNVQTTVMVLNMVDQQARRSRPVSSEGPTGPVDADPMARGLAAPGGADRAYSSFVRESLIDAILDSSAVLPLGPDDHLTIAASGIDQPGANLLYQSRKLMLTIKGSDLQEFRQGKLTRDDARARIVEGRF